MNVLILGATGGTGLQLVRRSLLAGHTVTAFVRNAGALKEYQDQIKVVMGDPLDPVQLAIVAKGQDAVISGLGPRVPVAKSDEHLLRAFAESLTTAMKLAEVRRLVIISTAFLFKDSVLPPTYLVGRLLFPSVVKDSTDLEKIIRESQTEWTIVRPPQLTDGPYTGKYRERIGHLPFMGFKISRADVADYFVKILSLPSLVRQTVGISN